MGMVVDQCRQKGHHHRKSQTMNQAHKSGEDAEKIQHPGRSRLFICMSAQIRARIQPGILPGGAALASTTIDRFYVHEASITIIIFIFQFSSTNLKDRVAKSSYIFLKLFIDEG